ncbi:MAG: nucleoside-diphosphate kinase [Planctomycetes bacterium]|nr:nucleoside-diphosphate kinase [Planctomycetota bacterium]
MAFQRTLIIVKPDGVARGIIGQILSRFENKGFRIAAMRIMQISLATAKKHYAEHAGKPFYPGLLKFITCGPVVVMAIEGNDAIRVCRKMMGATFGPEAEPGTIRGDFGISRTQNLIHGSDSPKSAKRELALYFKTSDYVKYPIADMKWIYNLGSGQPV